MGAAIVGVLLLAAAACNPASRSECPSCNAPAGGAMATGGSRASGGAPTTGGSPAMGGAKANGGSASSGSSTGGSASGGAANGGIAGAGGVQGFGGAAPVLYEIVIASPKNGETARGRVQINGWARGFLNVEVWDDAHQDPPLARATPGPDGAFSVEVDARTLPAGATTWTIWGWDSPAGTTFNHSDHVSLALVLASAPGGTAGAGGNGGGGIGGASAAGGASGSTGGASGSAGGRNYLLGFYTNHKSTPPYHTWLGYYPEVRYDSSYQEHQPGGSFYLPKTKYPIVLDADIAHARLDYADVASGKADTELMATRDSIPSDWYAWIYAIRIDSEFNLDVDPDPAVYAKAVDHVIALYKEKLPARVKYIWNPNIYHGDNLEALVPSSCDVIGIDAYAQPPWKATSQYLFDNKDHPAQGSLWWWTQIARKKGKPIALPEWGDDYADGTYIRDVAAWAADPANNVVFLGYWDSTDAENASLRGSSLEAFTKVFANQPYTGTFFAPLLAPTTYPDGF